MKKDNRTIRLYVRLTEFEFKKFKKKLDAFGGNTSDFIRQVILNENLIVANPITLFEVSTVLAKEANKIGVNLNQIAKFLNQEFHRGGISEEMYQRLEVLFGNLYEKFDEWGEKVSDFKKQ
jgi:hypothetical protein